MAKKMISLLLCIALLFAMTACVYNVHASDDDQLSATTVETLPEFKPEHTLDNEQDLSTVTPPPQEDSTPLEESSNPSQIDNDHSAEQDSEVPVQRVLDPDKPMVALTFDDGPHATHTDEILDILEENDVVATFFQVGCNLQKNPDAVRRAEAMGCEIGGHSYRHADLGKMSADAIAEDLEKADAAFVEVLGHAPNLLRPPYGSLNKAVKSTTGRSIITWSIDTEDWLSRDTDKIVAAVQGVSDLNGQVILMHDVYETTVEATRILVPWLIQQGYQLVTISELITLHYQDEVLANGLYGYSYFTYGKPVILPEGTTPEPSKPSSQEPSAPASQDAPSQQPSASNDQDSDQEPNNSVEQPTVQPAVPSDQESQQSSTSNNQASPLLPVIVPETESPSDLTL